MATEDNKQLLEADDPLNKLIDLRHKRAREMVVFMEETKIWQEMVTTCAQYNGVAAYKNCKHFYEILEERMKYYNSRYEDANLPKQSPGLPEDVRNVK